MGDMTCSAGGWPVAPLYSTRIQSGLSPLTLEVELSVLRSNSPFYRHCTCKLQYRRRNVYSMYGPGLAHMAHLVAHPELSGADSGQHCSWPMLLYHASMLCALRISAEPAPARIVFAIWVPA